ncbi:DUF4097 domain-containing protein [Fructobacillus sp. M158]|uniref:DUF4097 family beta strand repeat-containing protein n=1 Tax=Fructobacillus parabroussonetiae TaxID=2713174 RepID=UPI00200AB7B1|nr:DUF4097 family beta strand repeat-containing protein [Fructobacillus parabroussonetiae]MCK8617267.1 DUF4097 domain-containing protein [Fructobacillus parabroussonetiae]
MNKKIWFGSFLLLLGAVLMGLAFSQDGFPGQIYWNNGPVYLSERDEKGEVDLTPDQIASGKQELTGLDLSVKNADVTVRSGEHFAISVDRAEKNYVTVSSTDGLVKVTGDERSGWSWGINQPTTHHITITLPEKTTLQSLSLASLNGDLTVKNSRFEQLQIKNTNGDVTLSDVKVATSGDMTNRYGDIFVKKSTLPKLKTYSRYGDINVTSAYQNVTADQAVFSLTNLSGDISLT